MKSIIDKLNSTDRLPPSLKADLWIAFAKAFEDELLNIISEKVEPKKYIYDIDNMDYDQLVEISDNLGVSFNATIDDSIEFLRQEVKAIPFKIQYKDTVIVYQSFYKSLSRLGQVYVYFFKSSSDNIIRSTQDLLLNLGGQDVTEAYQHLSAENFTGVVENALKLDTGLILDVENEGVIWTLDTVDSEITTNHLGIEFFIDRLITKDWLNPATEEFEPREYMMTWEYHDFIQVNVDFSRRVIQVPHVGSQTNVIVDISGYVNPYTTTYTIPDLKLKACVEPTRIGALASVYEIDRIEFGIGAITDLPVKEGGGTFPSTLDIRIAEQSIFFDEKYESDDYFGVVAEYKGQRVNKFVLHDASGYALADAFGSGAVDGINNDFQGTLLFPPIKKQNVRFKFTYNLEEYIIEDDGKGVLVSEGAAGTIDYDTGQYVFSTDFNYTTTVSIGTGDGIETIFGATLTADSDIIAGSVKVVYNIGNKRYIAYDDGVGNITGTNITTGTIDYSTLVISLEFSSPITNGENVNVTYKFNRIYTPDAATTIEVDYYFTNTVVEITECGLYNESDELVAYATFPPVEFSNSKNHLNFGFIIKKTAFTSQIL